MSVTASPWSIGPLLRSWRQRRHLTQLELANEAGVTTRHLSFVETGRSRPSREMVLHLAEQLDVPLRERNNLLLAAGFAPTYRQRDLSDESFEPVRIALDQILAAHEPYPAVVIDRHWNLVSANRAATILTEDVAAELLEPPVCVLRVALHPQGCAPRVRNLTEWSEHLIGRIQREAAITGDEELVALEEELRALVGAQGTSVRSAPAEGANGLAIPLLLDSRRGPLALITMVATFGTALDITLAELSLETFLPADEGTTEILRDYARARA
jgi:transcriptional regulator with XRE-family HTH domain